MTYGKQTDSATGLQLDKWRCSWRGTDRRGGGRCGVMTIPPAALAAQVETRFRQGWRRLVVERDGLVVAEIKRGDRGWRTWYAETAEAAGTGQASG
jgi:hypothetical protein